ncbi:hypothetical protein ACHWQZ_G008350 [Mnemiopsis leidyi]
MLVSAASILGSLLILAIFISAAWFILWKLLLSKMPVFRAMFGLDKEDSMAGQSKDSNDVNSRTRKVK